LLKIRLACWIFDWLAVSPSIHLVDGDLLVGWLRGLRHDNFEDAILKASLDAVLIDARWEREAAIELANRAFANPELGLVGRSLLDFLPLSRVGNFNGSSAFNFGRRLIRFVFVVLPSLGYPALLLRWTGLVARFDATGDGEGVAIGPLDVDVLLLNARELTVKRVSFLCLADIELRLERA